ncbi:hypothetical protein MLD38_027203 [Melastoma candidum]|uniref:Uncharacterized protein n=1 Tax=Melastoma candidum TaxID=119954 RepID=A0ACB9P4B3_9MYRT|nr:hypothetical protein MLD38_027203 [Melastoma candidum]
MTCCNKCTDSPQKAPFDLLVPAFLGDLVPKLVSFNARSPLTSLLSSSSFSATLLAASKKGRCTCLVYSCYASTWSFSSSSSNGCDAETPCNRTLQEVKSVSLVQGGTKDPGARSRSGSSRRICRSSSMSSEHRDPDSIQRSFKSNLRKKPPGTDRAPPGTDVRKVSWPDAHGQDIAHVHEFVPSVSDDGELRGVKNSCVCAIQ